MNGRTASAPADEGLTAIGAFLSAQQCASIRAELAFAHWYPSMVVGPGPDGVSSARISACRTSESTDESWFTPQLARRIRGIDRRIAALFPGFAERREEWQATRYFTGGAFRAHFDTGHWQDEPAGEREHTVLIFLDTPRAGGETCFPLLDVAIRARTGLFLAWCNLAGDGNRDARMVHSSLPVRAGRKTVLVTWLRQRPYERRRR
ncbi:MAG: prolyl 4-hydroxylase [Sphingomonadales bacterium]|jgi:prolyl 4-hydroxylase|nr:prolyl 4-hydroxylase [Sphingomonadales bacterium]